MEKIIGCAGLTNTASLNVHELNDQEEYVVASINNIKPRKHKLYYNTKGVFFNFGGSRFYLDEIMRV